MGNVYDVVGIGIASWDLIGVAAGEPMMGAKQGLRQWTEASGGPVATALVTLARLGMQTRFISAVGNDTYGPRIVADLQREGVETSTVQIYEGTSHVAFALVEPEYGQRTIWWHNDRSVLDSLVVEQSQVVGARALHIDTHMPTNALAAARWMQESGGLVMIDAERYKESTVALLPYCNIIVVSERFGRESTGEQDPSLSAARLYDTYGGVVVVTAGERGSWCVSSHEQFHTPAFQVVVRDTTGAGDVFHGAFLYGILRGWQLRDVARFASATAALKCQHFGGRAGIPRLEEIQKLLEK